MSSLFNENESFKFSVINEAIDVFYHATSLPVFMINSSGDCIASTIGHYQFCYAFRRIIKDPNICRRVHLKESLQPGEWGQSHVFTCPSFVMHFSAPIIYKGTFKGSLIAGPFLLQDDYEIILNDLCDRYDLSHSQRIDLEDLIKTITVISPDRLRYLSKLLFILASDLLDEEKFVSNEKKLTLHKQSESSKINHLRKQNKKNISYPYDKEMDLYTKVTLGDSLGAEKILGDILKYVLFTSDNSIEKMRNKIVALVSILSRAAIQGGGSIDTVMNINANFIKNIQDSDDTNEMLSMTGKVLKQFMETMIKFSDSKNPEIINNAINFINERFMDDISLEDVANYVFLNPSYFSTLFKAQMKEGFSDYLNKVRVRESKKYLRSTDFSILEVATMVGYESQSYYSKMFKKFTHQTPSKYRNETRSLL